MRKIIAALFFFFSMMFASCAYALLNLELTQGVAGAVPISVLPFSTEGETQTNVSSVISNDLQNSGRFKVFADKASADNLVVGKVQSIGGDQYQVNFQLQEAFKGKEPAAILTKSFTVRGSQLRSLAHHISDLVYEQILGIRGIFSTRIAYILVQRPENAPARYILEVADQDGFNPKPLLNSADPIMSPSWSPNGRQIAYVSFENKHAAIYVQDVSSAGRRLISEFPGINGAPSWSPDGRKLALVLSKSGSPNIYILDLASKQLTQLTRDFYINTEPSWSPDGRNLVFTSNRSGNPQIYQLNLATKSVSRLTYDGKYNARASYTRDGKHLVVLNQDAGLFNIGILNLDDGTFRVLTNAGNDSESPSIAPNSSMVLYGTLYNGRSVLGMVATDASVQVRLPARNGEVQDPAWSPFLS